MKALDTNVLIRFLIDDEKKQAESARNFLENQEKAGNVVFVSIPVLLETLYVLDSVYNYTRKEIVQAVEMLVSMSVLEFERIDAVQLMLGSEEKFELEDMLIGAVAHNAGCTSTMTFDKKAARSELFDLLR